LHIHGSRFRALSSRFWVQGSGFRVLGSGFRVLGSRFWVQGSGFWVQGSRFKVLGSGFWVQGSRISEIASFSLNEKMMSAEHGAVSITSIRYTQSSFPCPYASVTF
jgi:hypothetical protein